MKQRRAGHSVSAGDEEVFLVVQSDMGTSWLAGYIGGRMVKWLEEITVTETESDNFYHFHDNRVLPSHVTEVLAKKEGVQSASS